MVVVVEILLLHSVDGDQAKDDGEFLQQAVMHRYNDMN